MKFARTELDGVWIADLEPHADERGSFARTYCAAEFAAHGLHTAWPQANVSRNTRRGTLRGLHFQAEPHPEIKLVRCTAGAIFDVVVDVRRGSPTFGRWLGVELTAAAGRALYIPAGFAHGFQTLADATEISYMMGAAHVPELARGVRWDDPAIGVQWPLPPVAISPRDAVLPLLADLA
jgi:dTDP-4-dehydrorhamnose 3,5-epimerase